MSEKSEQPARPRSHAIDALRGAAIVTMFAANMVTIAAPRSASMACDRGRS